MSENPSRLIPDRYRLGKLLGRGGMGRVWAARDELLKRDVAIKELLPPHGLSEDETRELRERVIREARAIARLDHRNVVRVFDVFFADDEPWIVMELVPSRSLYQAITADGPMEPARVARIGLDLLSALTAAHRAGLLHRDVKPANVLLGEDGRVVLTDFGLAAASDDSNLTSTGVVLGSPSYLAPERALDGEVGPASDLWSLGATLYAAVEGKPPYVRSSPMATLAALATELPKPPERAGSLRPALAALLEKDPARRADAETAERLLREATEPAATVAAPVAPPVSPAAVSPAAAAPLTAAAASASAFPSGGTPTEPLKTAESRLARVLRSRRGLVIGIAAALVVVAGFVARPILSTAQADDQPDRSGEVLVQPTDAAAYGPQPTVSTKPRHGTSGSVSASPSRTRQASETSSPGVTKTTAATVTTAAATATTKAAATGRIVTSIGEGTCLYAADTTSDIRMWSCNGGAGELFTFASDGTLRVRGKCVQINSTDDGERLHLATCTGSKRQQIGYNAGTNDVVASWPDKCVDVTDSGTGNGVPAQIWTCAGTPNQKWTY